MNREDIIKLAQEAKLIRTGENYTEPARWGISEITDFYNRAVAHEREACAKVCDVLAVHPEYASDITKLAAQAIRARGDSETNR